MTRALRGVEPILSRNARAVLLLEGDGPESLVACVLGGVSADFRLAAARLPEAGRETGGVVELVPPGSGAVPGGPRTRANVALSPMPGGAGDPDVVPADRLFAPADPGGRRAVLGGRGRARRRGRRDRRPQAARRAGQLRGAAGRDPRGPGSRGASPPPRAAAGAATRRGFAGRRRARAPARAAGRPGRPAAVARPRRARRRRTAGGWPGSARTAGGWASGRTATRPRRRSPTAWSGPCTACCRPPARSRRPRSSTGSRACSSAPTSPTRPSSAPASTATAASPARRTCWSRPTT